MLSTKSLLVFENVENRMALQNLIFERYPTSQTEFVQLDELEQKLSQISFAQIDERPIVVVTDRHDVIELTRQSKMYLPVVLIENTIAVETTNDQPSDSVTFSEPTPSVDFSKREDLLESLDQAFGSAKQFQFLKSRASNLEALAERERKIIQLAADGVPNKTIAVRLGVSIKTVEKNRRNAYSKLSVSSTAEMASVVTFEKFFAALV